MTGTYKSIRWTSQRTIRNGSKAHHREPLLRIPPHWMRHEHQLPALLPRPSRPIIRSFTAPHIPSPPAPAYPPPYAPSASHRSDSFSVSPPIPPLLYHAKGIHDVPVGRNPDVHPFAPRNGGKGTGSGDLWTWLGNGSRWGNNRHHRVCRSVVYTWLSSSLRCRPLPDVSLSRWSRIRHLGYQSRVGSHMVDILHRRTGT